MVWNATNKNHFHFNTASFVYSHNQTIQMELQQTSECHLFFY